MKSVHRRGIGSLVAAGLAGLWLALPVDARQAQSGAQAKASAQAKAPSPTAQTAPAAVVQVPADYVIGPEDVLGIVFWRETDVSADVVVRPDGKISLPLLNDVHAAGLTPDQLRARLAEGAKRYLEDPNPTVVVKQINSRKVFVTGNVTKPGPYPLLGPTTVIQLLAMAGGVLEYADKGQIAILRTEQGRQTTFRFNYNEVSRRKNLSQNILLKPGDTIIVP
jgi:polysaccharide export outer membrane protein